MLRELSPVAFFNELEPDLIQSSPRMDFYTQLIDLAEQKASSLQTLIPAVERGIAQLHDEAFSIIVELGKQQIPTTDARIAALLIERNVVGRPFQGYAIALPMYAKTECEMQAGDRPTAGDFNCLLQVLTGNSMGEIVTHMISKVSQPKPFAIMNHVYATPLQHTELITSVQYDADMNPHFQGAYLSLNSQGVIAQLSETMPLTLL